MSSVENELNAELEIVRTKRAFQPEQFVSSRIEEFLKIFGKI